MSRQLYEFWGNYFLNLAHGQQQLDNLTALTKQGLTGMNDLASLYRRCTGLEAYTAADKQSTSLSWRKAMADFQRSLNRFAVLWGWVPMVEYQRVIGKCNALKNKVETQDAVIRQLRDLLYQEGCGHSMLIDHWKRSFEEQSAQFQSLMKSLGSSFDMG